MRFQPFASGSSGNCCYIGTDRSHVLVDAGISRKRTAMALKDLDLSLDDLGGLLITHEHSDHISGLPMIMKATQMPVYATRGTIAAILSGPKGQELDPLRFVEISEDVPFSVGDLTIQPMTISHDAVQPVGYRLESGGKKAAVCTDLGCYTDYTAECLRDADVLLLEANHDVNMLQVGPYPYHLKQRILGSRGHLSNASSGKLLTEVLNDHMKGIWLGHLSQENNLPELAFETVRVEILCGDTDYRPEELPIKVARRREVSDLVEF